MIRSGTIQVFSKNRDRLLTSEIAQDLLAALLAEPKVKPLLSHEHFSIDGTLLNAWASMTSLPRLARDRAQPVALLLLPALSFAPGHGAQHAFLEREMIQHVVYSGCLVGKLKRPETPKAPKAPKDWPAIRYARVQKRIIAIAHRADMVPTRKTPAGGGSC